MGFLGKYQGGSDVNLAADAKPAVAVTLDQLAADGDGGGDIQANGLRRLFTLGVVVGQALDHGATAVDL